MVDGGSLKECFVLDLRVDELQVVDLVQDVVDLSLPLLEDSLHLYVLETSR